ncbi:MAG: hypothetical protein J1F36_03870 [Clostridiales bacterium]|nr:hypothetical protein [Clostridiales bacterium]
MITVLEVNDRKTYKDFFNLPYILYKKGHPHNVPPLKSEEEDEFDPKVNGAFAHCESKMFVAYKDGKLAGRVAGILNKKYNEKVGEKQIRFTRYDVIDDIEVSRALIDRVSAWGKELGMNKLIGPIGFSDFDKQGMLVEGFEEMDLYVTIYNYPYYVTHMEQLGFTKEADWIEFEIKVPDKPDERIDRLCDLTMKRYGFRYLEIKNFKSVEPYFSIALNEIMNEVYYHLYGYVTMNQQQIDRETKLMKQIFIPDCATAIMHGDELVGYGFMAPNISEALKKANGHIFPKGLVPFIKALKHYDKVDFYSIGVRKKYQGKGVNAMILNRGLKNLIKNGVKYVYTGPELETNNPINNQWRGFERRQNRRRRCWGKEI